MNPTTRWTLAGCMVLAAMAVFDIGSSTAEAAPSVSPFAGSYVGRAPRGTTFLWRITISDGGQITSSFKGDGRAKGSITGQVGDAGSYSMKVSTTYFVGHDPSGREGTRNKSGYVTSTQTIAGTMTLDVHGNIVITAGAWGSTTWLRQ